MNAFTTLAAAFVIGALAVVGFAYSGLYDVSARSPHSAPIDWLLSTTSHASVARRAKDVAVPNLDNDDLVLAGANDFDAMCIGCHGAPGKEPTALARGLNPPAPDLAESVEFMTPAELFWVTKHGIKMTGMPAWGATHKDDELWPVVALMMALPTLDAPAYQALLRSAGGAGHAAPGHHEPPSVAEPTIEAKEHGHAHHAH
ncbi:MAG: cytochrome c [Gammaproteobacteria bacterium]|nr:MAG: cytochrome c [Gammaproteobacteria bacterium]